MTLNPHPTFPSAGHYVLRLHQDARPEAGQLTGRIQHVSSGDSADFVSTSDLLTWLMSHAAQHRPEVGEPHRDDT